MANDKEIVVSPECKAAIDKALEGSSIIKDAQSYHDVGSRSGVDNFFKLASPDDARRALATAKAATIEAVLDSHPACNPTDLVDQSWRVPNVSVKVDGSKKQSR